MESSGWPSPRDEYAALCHLPATDEEWAEHDRLVQRYARQLARRRGLDDHSANQPLTVRELANELHLRLLQLLRRGGRITHACRWLAINADQVLYQAMAQTQDSPENITARKRLRTRQAAQEAELGRSLTGAEVRALARELVEESHGRVHPDFWTYSTRTCSTLDAVDAGGNRLFDPPDEDDPERAAVRQAETVPPVADSPAGQVLDPGTSKWEVNYLAWDALAQTWGGPRVRRAGLSHRQATGVRTRVAAAGGARAVAEQWRAGELDDPVVEALFAPFGELDDTGRAEVYALLTHVGLDEEQAQTLWGYAVMAADRSRSAPAASSDAA